jgi:hypothetical protein
MVASTHDPVEKARQSLLTFRLSTAIAVLTALLARMLGDRYFGLGAAVEAVLEEPMTSPLNSKLDKKPDCSADAASKIDSSVWAKVCPPTNSTIKTPATTKIVVGSKIETL